MNLCFNDLCMQNLPIDKYQASSWMENMIDLIKCAHEIDGDLPELRTLQGFYSLQLCKDFNVLNWLQTLAPEKRIFFYSIIDKSPYLQATLDSDKYELAKKMDFFYEDKKAMGLGVAWLLDGIALSFPSSEKWATSLIVLKVEEIDENEKIHEDIKSVKHSSSKEHLNYHKQYYRSLAHINKKISNLEELKNICGHLFKFIRFGDTVFEWMEKNTLSESHFKRVIEKLNILNCFFEDKVSNGIFNLKEIPNCSGESECTRNRYYKERLFKFSGKERYCEWHLKLNSMNLRIHFDPDFENKIAYVGYIGPHLSTCMYP